MSPERGAGLAVAARRDSRLPTFERPAELVEIAERLYRGVFAAGLWVAVGSALFGTVGSLLQPAGYQTSGVAVCGTCVAAMLVTAVRPAPCYRLLRRHPWTLLIPAGLLAAGALIIGERNYQLLVPMAAVIGAMGIATPLRVVAAAGLFAATALAAPHVTSGHGDDIIGVIGVFVPPLMYWLIVDRIAGFALRLHQTLGAEHRAPRRRDVDVSTPQSRPQAASQSDAVQRTLPAPRVIEFAGTRMTSRQLQVLLLACEGLKHGEIGACLGIGPQQVRRHLRDARERTGSPTRAHLVAWARRTGLVPRRDADPAVGN